MTISFPLTLLGLVLAVLVWSGIGPYDRVVWWLEVAPVLFAVPLLVLTYKKFRLTNLLYSLIALHCVVLMVGGHYTYAHVPLFDWIRDQLGTERNSYDGVGHFAQGFVPAIIGRELLLRTSPLKPGRWLGVILVLSCLGISAVYELIEWGVAVASATGAEEFLGMQGDVWDTQKDMALAGIGALSALIGLSSFHDRQLRAIN